MAVPKFKEFFLPVLESFGDKKIHTKKEVSEIMASHFSLTDDEKNEKTKEGKTFRYKDRTGWAIDYLYRAKLLNRKKRGQYSISDEGNNVLNSNPDNIDSDFLMRYESFRKFKNGESANSSNDKEIDEVFSPIERLGEAFLEINEELSSNILEEILSHDSVFFEKLVLDLLLKMGYGGFRDKSGMITSQTNDEGIDGIINEDVLGLDKIAIQAKRHENTVGRPDLQKFSGALSGKGIKKGVFITTADFSRNAIEYANNLHESSIILIDGKKLANLMIEYDLGTFIVDTYHIKRIDSDYFSQEE